MHTNVLHDPHTNSPHLSFYICYRRDLSISNTALRSRNSQGDAKLGCISRKKTSYKNVAATQVILSLPNVTSFFSLLGNETLSFRI